ncbi:MAG: phosphoribosylamine--glycine ligase [Corynebacterium sp.]|nr:phosphoribosylamine--glycine ligase [Corynebacterium sp.]
MRILVIGSGAREHALLRGLSASTQDLHVVPGNAGMEGLATRHQGDINDGVAMTALAKELGADFVVVGPENPLVAGVADSLREAGFPVFGPSGAAAQLEGSKAFAKEVMAAAGVRTAHAETLEPGTSEADIDAALDRFGPTWVVKDDGLAAGKGVVVTPDRAAAKAHVLDVHSAGNPVLLESFLEGPEVSLFCLVDGETVVPLLPAQDHKRVRDNDEGPNTGGMGAYTPLPWLPQDGVQRIVDEVCVPVAKEMVRRGTPYSGLLYAGLAWGPEGPAVVEFNCRFGDPETQAVLALLETPLCDALYATATGKLAELPPLKWKDGYALTVVLAAKGYPESTVTGDVIDLSAVKTNEDNAYILHAGTSRNEKGELISAGGRVLSIIGVGSTLIEARERAYEVIKEVKLAGSHYRSDIALPAVEDRIL